MKKPALFITAIIFIIVTLSIVQVVVSNSLSTTGLALGKLEKEIADYKKQNAILREKLFTISSLTYVASKANDLGFVEEKRYVLLKAPLPLAVKR